MENNAQEMTNQKSAINQLSIEIAKFAAKTGIIIFGLLILISLALPDFGDIKDEISFNVKQFTLGLKRFETPATKLFLLSLVQNPAALWKYSEIEEADGKADNAIREMELAIGLLEMHGANNQTIKRYSDRLAMLKAKKTTPEK